MIWRLAWIETRRLFWIALGMLVLQFLFIGPLSMEHKLPRSTPVPIRQGDVALMLRDYPSSVWVWWNSRALMFFFPFIAMFFSSGGITAGGLLPRRAVPYLLSMPVRRRALVGARVTVGAAEFAATALFACLLVPAGSLLSGRSYPVSDAVLYAVQVTGGGLLFFAAAVLLAAITSPRWHKTLGFAIFGLLGFIGMTGGGHILHGEFDLMSGRAYILSGVVPWLPLAACVAAAAVLVCLSALIVERRDFS